MSTVLRRLLVGALAVGVVGVTACDNGTDTPATATVQITAYVDANNSNANDAGDVPVQGATITLSMVGSDAADLTATTDASGTATFNAVEVGSYTASIELPATLTGVTLASASSPTVVVEESGGGSAEFRYTYNPGEIAGHVFVGSGAYTDGDVVVPGVSVTISQDGTDLNTVETDATGAFTAGGLLPGDYTVTTEVPPYLSAATTSMDVTVMADAAATADFGMDINPSGTVADARAAAVDDTVSLVGIAITGNTGDQAALSGSSFYVQDESGISIYLAGVDAAVELGDSVLVYGVRGTFSDEVQLASLAVLNLGTGTLPTPTTVTAADINGGAAQGQLTIIQDVIVDSIPMSGGSPTGEVWVSEFNTGEDVVLYVDADAGIDIATTFTEGSAYDVTGVLARYFDLFELKPRMPADIAEETNLAMSVADARAETNGTAVTVTALVTEAGTLEGNGFYMQDATAGVFVYTGFGNVPAGLAIGDVVTVEGSRGEFNGVVQISGTPTVTEVRTATTPIAPLPLTVAELNTGNYQGQLVQLTDVTLDSIGTTSSSGVTLYVSEAASTEVAEVRLDIDSGLAAGGFTAGEVYTFVGVVTTFNGVEQVKPRFVDDAAGFVPVDTLTTVADARAADLGSPVELTGVVTVANGPSGTAIDYRNAYMQDATAGILIRMPTDSLVDVGDSVTVIGTTGSFASELQVNVDVLVRLGTGTVPTPRSVTAADIEAGLYQGELAVLDSVVVTDVSISTSGSGTITVEDGTDTTTVYVDADTDIDPAATFTVGNSYSITGVLSRYNATYEMKPRSSTDISAL